MSTSNNQAISQVSVDTAQEKVIWQAIKHSLEARRDQIYEEIHSYRPPIPACDVQFNFLIEERTRVAQELSRLQSLGKQKLPPDAVLPLLDEFLTASTALPAATKQTIRITFWPLAVTAELKARS